MQNQTIILLASIILVGISCQHNSNPMETPSQFNWQGHRGCRGLLPENTIPAFIKAIDIGVHTLELDIAISKDHKIIVSHEPWMSHNICSSPEMHPITEENEKNFKIYEMEYREIQSFDCGQRGNPRFPQQKPMSVSKPSLEDMFKACEQHINTHKVLQVGYNIEIKSKPEWDSIFTPDPEIFAEQLAQELIASGISMKRFCVQSFDIRPLQYLHQKHPEITLALLVEDDKKEISERIEELGFQPPIYSPYFKLLTKASIKELHERGMKIIPWTVNEKEDMERLIQMGVDGIITDYPNIPLAKG